MMTGEGMPPHPLPLPLLGRQAHIVGNSAGGGELGFRGKGAALPPPSPGFPPPPPLAFRPIAVRSTGEGVRGWGLLMAMLVAWVVLLAGATGPVAAQEPTPSDDEVNAIARGLYCPVCENVPLDVCPTQACEQWRATIREKLTLGWTEDEIKAYFVAQYGDRVLASPPARGFNWLVYVLPPLVILAAGVFLWQTMRRWRVSAAEPEPSTGAPDQDPYVQRMEEELRRRG